MGNKLVKYGLPALAVVALAFSIYQVVLAHQAAPAQSPPIEPPRTPFGKTIAGAGIVEAETENIAIGTPLSGVVLEVYVPVDKVGQKVKAGDRLFLVDNRQLKAQLAYARANLQAAAAQLAKLRAMPRKEEVPPLEAAVKAARENMKLQKDNENRYRDLLPQNAVPKRDYDQSVMLRWQAQFQLEQAQKNLDLMKQGAWVKDVNIAEANVAVARAQVEQVQTDLDRALVRAPVDGIVLQVNVRPGEYVGTPPSQALFVLGNVNKLHVRVDVDEHDIPRAYRFFDKSVPAFASPRGDPSLRFPLTFVRVEPYVIPKKSLTGDNTERVDTRVLQVVYRVNRSAPGLYVGMQVDVFLNGEPEQLSSGRK